MSPEPEAAGQRYAQAQAEAGTPEGEAAYEALADAQYQTFYPEMRERHAADPQNRPVPYTLTARAKALLAAEPEAGQ